MAMAEQKQIPTQLDEEKHIPPSSTATSTDANDDLTRKEEPGDSATVPSSAQDGPGPPPDGGLQAWIQAVVAHLVIFNTWGYINSFGVFQTYYVQHLGHPPSDISWVGSVQIFLLFFIGTLSGRATDAGYFRPIFIAGTMLQLLGVFMTSLSTKYWQLFLAQGVCTGIGSGLLFCPTLALIPTYFTRNRAIAIGIAASGTTTGGMLLPGVVEAALPRVGFGWTVRIIGFIMLAFQLISLALARTRVPPRKIGSIIELSAFKEPQYALFAIGIFFCFWGIYPAYYYVGEYATSIVGVSYANSVNLLIIMNGIGIIGRLIPPFFADKYTGPANMMIPFVLLSSISLYCWPAIRSQGGLFAFATIYGLFSSAVNALFPTTLASLTTDMTKMGTRMGMVYTTIAFATLTGTPIAGAVVGSAGGYLGMELFAASLLMIGACFLIAARVAGSGMRLMVRM